MGPCRSKNRSYVAPLEYEGEKRRETVPKSVVWAV